MQVLRWHGRGDLRVDDVEFTEPLGGDEVEIDVAFCGICGSDVAEFRDGPVAIRDRPHALTGQRPPITLGHEFSGTVIAVGDAVRNLQPGDRVAADATLRCTKCAECINGRYNHCALGGSIGLAADGAMAEQVRIPAYAVVRLPDEVTFEAGALIEPFAVAYHALVRGAAVAGDSVIVVGFGPIGAAAADLAHAIGVSVLVSEPNPGRRALAQRLGHSVFAPTGDHREDGRELRSLTGGGAQVVLECSGSAAGLESSLEVTRRGGNIVVVGIPKSPVTVDAARLVLFERAVVGTLGYQSDLPRVATMMATGALDASRLVSRTVPLGGAVDEFKRLATDPGADLKVLISPRLI